MLYEVAKIQDFVPIDILHEVRYQYDKMIPRLAMLIMVVSYLDDHIESDFDRILLENCSIYEVCIHHLNAWILTTKSPKVISKVKQYLGKDAAIIIRGIKNLEVAIFRASHSINKIKVSVMKELKKEIDCIEFPIEKFKQDMEIAMMNSVKKDQYCFLEMTKLSKMVASRLVSWIRLKLEDIKYAKLCIVGL